MSLAPLCPPMKERDILQSNIFSVCTDNELIELWNALREYYANCYVPEQSVLNRYLGEYNKRVQPGLGMIALEQDLLRAIAIRFAAVSKFQSFHLAAE